MNLPTYAAPLTLAITFALVGGTVHLVARPWSTRQLFFVSLGRELNDGDRARARRLMRINGAVTAVGIAASFLVHDALALTALVSLLPMVSIAALIVEMVRLARETKQAPAPARFAVPLDEPPPLWRYLSPPLHIGQLLLLGLSSAWFLSLRSGMPDIVPIHWNAQGKADGFGSPDTLWMFAAFMLFDVAVVWLVALMMARERWALPPEDPERYADLQMRRRTLITRMVEVMMLAINASMAVMWLGIAYGSTPGHGDVVMLSVVGGVVVMSLGTIAPLAMYLSPLTELQEQIRELAGSTVLGTHESGWRWGGLIYWAPEDPAVFVPKRLGIGQTLNFGRPGAWAFLVGITVAPLLLTWGVIAFTR